MRPSLYLAHDGETRVSRGLYRQRRTLAESAINQQQLSRRPHQLMRHPTLGDISRNVG